MSEAFGAGMPCYELILTRELKLEKEQETVISDTLPDGAEVVECCPCVLMRSKEVFDGLVRLQAQVQTSIVFRGEDGQLYNVEQSITADFDLADEKISSACVCESTVQLSGWDAWLSNPRKLAAKLDICARICVYRPDVQRQVSLENICGLYLRPQKARASRTVALREKTCSFTDELTLPQNCPAAEKLLCRSVIPVVEEVRRVGEKLMVKGRVDTRIFYVGRDKCPGAADISSAFSQIVDGGGEGELIATAAAAITGAYFDLDPDSGGRRIKAELHLLLQTRADACFDYEYISDAYCNTAAIETKTQETALILTGELQRRNVTVEKTIDLPENPTEIISCRAYTAACCVNSSGATVWVSAVYRGAEGEICAVRRRIEAEIGNTADIADIYVEDCQASISGESIALRLDLYINRQEEKKFSVSEITDCSMSQEPYNEKRPSVTLLRATNRDDIWSIAKKYCSSETVIRDVNALDSEEGEWEKVIIVPKCK